MVLTASSLKTEIAAWLNRTDLNSRVPTFIRLLEADFRGKLFHRNMLKRSSTTIFVGDEFVLLPEDFVKVGLFWIQANGSAHQLRNLTTSNIIKSYPNRLNGIPEVFAIVGNEIQLMPIAIAEMSLELQYYAAVPSLVENETNWLLTQYPDVYFYGTLAIANKAIQNDVQAQLHYGLYEAALAKTINESELTRFDEGPLEILSDTVTY